MTHTSNGYRVKVGVLSLLILSLLSLLLTVSATVYGDRGGFSLRGKRVSESGQKAIVAWNGNSEVLVLSTDVASSQESEVLEIMPLPANPTVSKGDESSFSKIRSLVNTYFALTRGQPWFFIRGVQTAGGGQPRTPEVDITFQEMIGVHYLTVVRSERPDDLLEWLTIFLSNRNYTADLPADLGALIAEYMQDEINFFVIDMIMAGVETRTVDTLVYEFRSSELYYPLRISSLFSGDTAISLFTVTSGELESNAILGGRFVKEAQFQIKRSALNEISSNMSHLFSGDPYVCYFRFRGALNSFHDDLTAESGSQADTLTPMLATVEVFFGLMLVLLFLPRKRSFGFKRSISEISITKRLQVSSLLIGFVGLFLICYGFLLPWGLVEFGSNGEILLQLNGIHATMIPIDIVGTLYFALLVSTVICYFYLLATMANSATAPKAYTGLGTCILLLTIILSNITLYTVKTGVYSTLMGGSLVIIAGLLSFWRMKLGPEQRFKTSRRSVLCTYIARRFLIAALKVIGVTTIIFMFYYYFWTIWGIIIY